MTTKLKERIAEIRDTRLKTYERYKPTSAGDLAKISDDLDIALTQLAADPVLRESILNQSKGGDEPCKDTNESQAVSVDAETRDASCVTSDAAQTFDPDASAKLRERIAELKGLQVELNGLQLRSNDFEQLSMEQRAELKTLRSELLALQADFEKEKAGWINAAKEQANAQHAHAVTILALRAQVAKIVSVMKAKLPNTGPWENECPYCYKKVPHGELEHTTDCPITVALSYPDLGLLDRVGKVVQRLMDTYEELHTKYDLGDCDATINARQLLSDLGATNSEPNK